MLKCYQREGRTNEAESGGESIDDPPVHPDFDMVELGIVNHISETLLCLQGNIENWALQCFGETIS